MNEEHSGKLVLGIIGLFITLIIGGLIWAILAGPSSRGPSGSETGLHFSDDNDPAKGPSNAKVTVRMFGDFQCPACRAAEPGVQYAMKAYADQVRFIWNDYPLFTVHKNAMAGANAARCAEEQAKFWEFHDVLYGHQSEWSDQQDPNEAFAGYAGSIGLKVDDFKACVASRRYQSKIQNDMDEGNSNSVNSTPTFFINNVRVAGGISSLEWDQYLKAQLSTTSTQS